MVIEKLGKQLLKGITIANGTAYYSLVPRPRPAFRRLQWGEPGIYSQALQAHLLQYIVERAWERGSLLLASFPDFIKWPGNEAR